MKNLFKNSFLIKLIVVFATLVLVNSIQAQSAPPGTVARLSYLDGIVSFSAANSNNEWVNASLNRPLVTGDSLWVDNNGKVEIQVNDSAIHLTAKTSIILSTINDNTTQIQLDQGSLNLHIKTISKKQVYEVDTPNLAFNAMQPGDYRIDVNQDGNFTTVTVLKGEAQVSGEGTSFIIDANQSYKFTVTNLNNYQTIALASPDDFDHWVKERDNLLDNAAATQHVSSKIPGATDLDKNGTWKTNHQYGNIWVPSGVPSDWAPYSAGQWVWVDPYGWTWIDNAPWGYAPYHYGRWVFVEGGWAWVPGPINEEPVFAPALVGFVAGVALVSTIAWFPLGPGEAFFPPYYTNVNYFTRINIHNTIIKRAYLNKVFVNKNEKLVYRNQHVRGAIIAAEKNTFAESMKIDRKTEIKLNEEALAKAKISDNPDIKPTPASKRGGALAKTKPPRNALDRPTIVRTKPAHQNANIKVIKPTKAVRPSKRSYVSAPHHPEKVIPHPPEIRHPVLHKMNLKQQPPHSPKHLQAPTHHMHPQRKAVEQHAQIPEHIEFAQENRMVAKRFERPMRQERMEQHIQQHGRR